MASQYADLFEYASFAVTRKNTIEYTDVKLLKDMCDNKSGTKVDKIVLNPADGSWSIPKSKGARPAPVPAPKKKVEFKGVHTRFEDNSDELGSDESLDKSAKPELVYIPNTIISSTFKVFQGRMRVRNIPMEYEFIEEFSNYIHDMGSGSNDTIAVNHSMDFIRVAGIDLESSFEVNKRYKLPSGNFSIVRIY